MPKFVPIVITADDKNAQAVVRGLTNAFTQLDERAEQSGGGMRNAFLQADLGARVISAGMREASAAVQEFLRFGGELANLNTLLDDSSWLPKYRDGLLNLDPYLGNTSELARGMYQAISSGVDAADALDAIEQSAKTARAGLADTFSTVDMGTSVMASFGLKGKDLVTIYDKAFEVVKRGKVELPQLASSIGLVSSFAAQAGVSLDEMFAAVATGSRTNRPTIVIEGMRTALANIVKPSEQALEVARELGIDFSASALKAKGFAQFLDEVATAANGDTAKLARLFGDVQGLNFVLSITGNQSKQFADDLRGIANASGTVEEAFEKQKQSLSAQAEAAKVMFQQGLMKGLMLVEPLLTSVLSLVTKYPAVFIAAATVVTGLALAHAAYNTQLGIGAATFIPNLIKGLQTTVFWMGNLRTAMTTALAAGARAGDFAALASGVLGWAGLAAAAIGLLVYAYQSYETAVQRAEKITLESIQQRADGINVMREQAAELKALADKQSLSAEEHDKLNRIIESLDPNTRTYIQTLGAEGAQVAATTRELERRLEIERTLAGAKRVDLTAGIVERQKAIEQLQAYKVELGETVTLQGRMKTDGLPNQLDLYAEKYEKVKDSLAEKTKAQVADIQKVEVSNQLLGESRQQYLENAQSILHNTDELGLLRNAYNDIFPSANRVTGAQHEGAQAAQDAARAFDQQAASLQNLTTLLDNFGKSAGAEAAARQKRIKDFVAFTTQNAVAFNMSPEQAAQSARELANRYMPQVNADLDQEKRARQAQGAIEKGFGINKDSSGSGSRTSKVVDQADRFRLSEVRSIQEFFRAATGRELPISAYGQTPTHNRFNLDHRNSVDVALHPDSALGKLLTEYLRERNIPFRAIREADIARGVKATAPHVHVGEPSHAFGKKTRSVGVTRVDDFDGQFLTLGGKFQQNPFSGEDDMTKPQVGGQLIQLTPAKLDGFLDKLGALFAKMRSQPLSGGTVTPFDQVTTYQNSPTQQALVDYNAEVNKREDAAVGRRIFREEYVAERLREIRTDFYDRETTMSIDLAGLEEALAQTRRQAADSQLSEQRRLLSAKGDEIELTRRLTDLQDEYANSFTNLGLRTQVAEWEELVAIKREDVEAIESQARSQVRLADAATVHTQQVRARVMDHMAQEANATDAWAKGIIGTYDQITGAVDRGISKLTHGVALLDSLLRSVVHQIMNRVFQRLLDAMFPSKNGESGGERSKASGSGFSWRNILGGGGSSPSGGSDSAGGGSIFNAGSIIKNFRQGGFKGGFNSLFGFGSSAASAATGAGAAALPVSGITQASLLGTLVPSSTAAGLGAGAAAGGGGAAAGAGAAGSSGAFSGLMPLLTNPWTAVAVGAAVAGFALWKHFSHGTEKALRKTIQSEYALNVKDMQTLTAVKQQGEEAFGRGQVKSHLVETIRLDPVKELLAQYAERTGQTSSSLTTNRELQDSSNAANQFTRRWMGGPVNAGQPYIVGDKGPRQYWEVFVPEQSGHIVPSLDEYEASQGSPLKRVMQKLREAQRRAAQSAAPASPGVSRSASGGSQASGGGVSGEVVAAIHATLERLTTAMETFEMADEGAVVERGLKKRPRLAMDAVNTSAKQGHGRESLQKNLKL